MRCHLTIATFLVGCCAAAAADSPTYWHDVRPVLRKHCTVCHSERKKNDADVSAGLALDSLDAIRQGGKTPVLRPGKPAESLLVTLLTEKNPARRMPLDADPLPAETIALLRRWVEAGAPEGARPADGEIAVAPAGRPKRTRKLDVTFPIKTALPKAGPLELTLPVGPLPPAAAVAYSPDGRLLAVGSYGRVTLWDLADARPGRVITNVLAAVNDVKFSPDGSVLAVAGGQPSARGDLRLFSAGDGKLLHSLGGHLDVVSSAAFGPDGGKLASASFDKTVRLWDAKAGKLLHAFTGHSDFVYAVSFSPQGDWYATAGKDRTARVIDAATGKSRLTFSGMEQEVLTVAARPDGGQVVTAGFEPQLHWWDTATGQRTRRMAGHNTAVYEIAFDPKGTVAVSAGGDGTVRVWNPQTGGQARTVQAGGVVYAVAVDPTGGRVAAGGADGLVRVFDVASGRPLATLWAGADGWLAVTPEGYVAAADGLLAQARWTAGGKPAATDPRPVLNDPGRVGQALRGEKVPEPKFGK